MKKAALAALAIVIGLVEFRDHVADWIPAVGALDSGYPLAQTLLLGFLAASIFAAVLTLSYRIISSILD